MCSAAQFYTRRIPCLLQRHGACFLMTCFFASIFICLIFSTLKKYQQQNNQVWLHSEMGGRLQRWTVSARKLPDKMGNCQIRWKVWTQICRSQTQKFSFFISRHACVDEPGQKEVAFPKDLRECDFSCLHELLCISQLWSSKPLLKTTPFKVFLQIITCNVPIISISHPAQNSLELKTSISSSETLVLILNQPAELNDVDVSLTSSKQKVNCGEEVTGRGQRPWKHGKTLPYLLKDESMSKHSLPSLLFHWQSSTAPLSSWHFSWLIPLVIDTRICSLYTLWEAR